MGACFLTPSPVAQQLSTSPPPPRDGPEANWLRRVLPPAARRVRGVWPAIRLSYVKLEIEPRPIKELLDLNILDPSGAR